MADNDNGIEGRPPDPFVAARINDPATPAAATFQLAGLLGDSDRDGLRRLYLNTALDYYVEFRNEDVVTVESVAPDQPPFVGLDATRISLKRDAQVEYVRTRAATTDAFTVDVQRGGVPGGFIPDPTDPTGTLPTDFTGTLPESVGFGCVPDTLQPRCVNLQTLDFQCHTQRGFTCQVTFCDTCFNATCRTCDDATCQTCGEATCQTCGQATCQTCVQATCATCNAATCVTCKFATCQTCLGNCWQTIGGRTCITCRITDCNLTRQQSVVTPCITQQGCPTLGRCP